jgi:hypothetical protein
VKRLSIALGAVMMAVVAACSGASNSGGRTTCEDFLAMTTANQDATIARMLKERRGANSPMGDIVTERLATIESCQPSDNRDVNIGDLG